MIATRKRAVNRRKSGVQHRRSQNLLEVTVRSRAAIQQRNRFILTWTCRLLLVVGIVVVGIYGVREGLRRFLWENPEYNLAAVEINDEGQGLTREAIMSTAGLRIGQNVFSFSLAKAREAVAALSQVDHVEMQRVLPNKVTIELVERRPVAWIADNQTEDATSSDKALLIDAKRVLFKPKRRLEEYLRLPVICGVPAENFLSGETIARPEVTAALDLILRNNDGGRFRIQSIDISKGYCMVATDTKRVQVTFGVDKVDRQLDRLGAVLDHFAAAHQEIQSVNLLLEKNIPVTFASAPDQEPNSTESDPSLAVAESSPHKADAVEAGVAKPAGKPGASLKKKAPAAESRETKKKPKRIESDAEENPSVPVKRARAVAHRAAPLPTPSSTAAKIHNFFSFFHGQR